ncbi:hypothetical protein RHO14_06855 [Orbus wheelerorum]|uniref:hypothetical protein n=1 Tax=Orbus wheelerorum TaxID=3074111 RepID=UPI00370DAF72
MKRLIEAKIMAIELDEMLNDPIRTKLITNEYTNLRRYIEKQHKILNEKHENNQLTELEETIILPALDDAYLYLLDSLKGNAKPDNKMRQIVSDIPDRIDYWLEQIK